MKRVIQVLLVVVAIGAGAGAYYLRRGGTEIQANTSPVTRGEIIDAVGATGTLQAVTTVQIGSQVSGIIAYLGADFNSIVHQGQVIARLDPSLFQAQVAQSTANLLRSRADLVGAQAGVDRNKVQLTDAQQKYARASELAAKNLLAPSDLDAAKTAVASAQASLQSTEASLQSAQAQVQQAQASLNQSQVNLAHCVIASPIDGIVIQRSVDVGQTVAASLQSPTLFIIAADLTKMQVNANIDEADVGRIRPNQRVVFKVDAYPADEFEGAVSQIRLQPVVVQNVTTYATIVSVPNPALKLKPGMTANLKVQVARRSDVLRVPNAALRFRPTADIFAALNQAVPPELQPQGGRAGNQRTGAAGPGAPATGSPADSPAAAGQRGASGATRPSGTSGGAPPMSAPQGSPAGARSGGGDGQGGGGRAAGGGGERGGQSAQQMMERFRSLPPEDRQPFIDRMKSRGQDVSAFEQAAASGSTAPLLQPKYGAPQSAETIDALFAPLQTTESRGRAWLYTNQELKSVQVRLGITDGSNTELIGDDLQPGAELVTGVIIGGVRAATAAGGTGNPLMPQQRGGPPGGGGGGRGR